MNTVRTLIGTTFPTANTLVDRMVELGILTEITGQARHRQFQYGPYVSLFA